MKQTSLITQSLLTTAVLLASLVSGALLAADKEPPDELVFESKLGNVTFDHAKHTERENGDCTVCHDEIFPQSKAPLNYKAGMHKPAEAKKESCATCHVDGGKSFASKGNCKTCHVK